MPDDPEIPMTYKSAIEALKATLSKIAEPFQALGGALNGGGQAVPPPLKGVTPEAIAAAFDVPLDLIHPPAACPEPVKITFPQQSGYVLSTPFDWSATITDWETSLKVAATQLDTFKSASMTFQLSQVSPELLKLLTGTGGPVPVPGDMPFFSNHTAGVAMDINSPNEDWQPDPELLEGSGDIGYGLKPYYKPFDVLGKASPVVVQHPSTKIYVNNLGKAEIQADGRSYVQLKGKPVSTSMGVFELTASIYLEAGSAEMAKKLIGVIPNDGPGTGVQLMEQSAGNQMFIWEAGTGWVPKESPAPLYATGGWPSKVPGWPVDGTRHLGPDGAVWEFHIAGGWIIAQVPDLLFSAGTELRAPYGWWCSFCEEHWDVHKGDPVGCESGGWLRPATSAEHKAMTL